MGYVIRIPKIKSSLHVHQLNASCQFTGLLVGKGLCEEHWKNASFFWNMAMWNKKFFLDKYWSFGPRIWDNYAVPNTGHKTPNDAVPCPLQWRPNDGYKSFKSLKAGWIWRLKA